MSADKVQNEKNKAIDLAVSQIERQFGKGAVMRLGDEDAEIKIDTISTGALSLDAALGIGGIPKGRIIEVYGPEASGKTTLALHLVANAQKAGGYAAFIDAEHALDPQYSSQLGVDTKNLLISQPDSGEQALEITETLVRSNALDIIVVDSVAALVPRAELEGEMGDSHVGLQARLMSQALYISRALARQGIKVIHKHIIGDEESAIRESLDHALRQADLVTITGGLGPTHDDITKHVLADYFGSTMVLHEDILDSIKARFERRGIKMAEINRNQAEYPDNATLLANPVGTARGMYFEREGQHVFVMPGVPRELKAMVDQEIIPIIKDFSEDQVQVVDVLTAGIPESTLYEEARHLFAQTDELKVAFLPKFTGVTIRLSLPGSEDAERTLENLYQELLQEFPKHVYGKNEDTLSSAVGGMLLKNSLQVATAESCTGGMIASTITDSSGSSEYFARGYVTYANEAKCEILGVKQSTLEQHGAVSEETVTEMLTGLLVETGADYGIAVSGIAGPTGGTPEKPVGTVYVGIASKSVVEVKRYQFTDDRQLNKELTVSTSLQMLRLRLMKDLSD